MKRRSLRIGAAGIIAGAMLLTGVSVPKAEAYSAKATGIKPVYFEWDQGLIQHIAKRYGIDLSTFEFSFNGLTIRFPGVGATPQPTATATPKPTATATPKPTATATPKPTATATPKPTATPQPTATTTPQPTATATPQPTDQGMSENQTRVVELVNQERAKVGLSALQVDTLLNKVATEKARDMDINRYFSHTSPTYGSPFDMMRSFGVTYSTAGENIASGQPTPERVMSDWMNSPGHKANILNQSFKKIGVGYVNGKWVQMFTG